MRIEGPWPEGYVGIVCANCAGVWGWPREIERKRRADGKNFTCPLCGCGNVFTKTTCQIENDRLRKELQQARHELDILNGKIQVDLGLTPGGTKPRREKGRWKGKPKPCPVCGVGFMNLGPHLRAKHPDYTPEGAA